MRLHSVLDWYSLILLAAGCWFVLLSLSNAIFFKISRRRTRWNNGPKISVLIPARNEEDRILPTLDALDVQDYADYEVIVIDDNSTDGTWPLIEKYAQEHPQFQALRGKRLPKGWKGKPFAMTQLGEHAQGDILVFIDADILPAPDFLAWTAERMRRHRADSLSAYARHKAKTVKEYIFFPLMYLVNMTFLPFWLIKHTKTSLFSHAIGQIMAFRREAYNDVGGFEVVKDKILEDIQMGRAMKRGGFRHVFLDARKVLAGDMYNSWDHTISGLKRCIYEYFDKKMYPFIILSFFIIAFLVAPVFAVILGIILGWSQTPLLALGTLGIFVGWATTLYDRKLPWYTPLFFPVQFAFIVFLGWKSLLDDISGRGYDWKGRKVL